MPKKNAKQLDAYRFPKRNMHRIHDFIEQASGRLSAVEWDVQWNEIHGEGRAKSVKTTGFAFHIGFRRISDGHYQSAIMVTLREGGRRLPVENTLHDWGTTEPRLIEILNLYKDKYGMPRVADPENGQLNGGEDAAVGAQD